MSAGVHVITGATGLLGSHIAEQLVARGKPIRVLARAGSDVGFVKSLGAEIVEGDANDPNSLAKLVAGAHTVYHSASQVGDWAAWKLYQRNTIDGTLHLLEACRTANVGRLLFVSSVQVYGRPRKPESEWIDEDEALGQRLGFGNYYAKSKIAAEKLVRESPVPWTIVRPSWLYGPRDRRTMPRLIKALRAGRVRILGDGNNFLNIIYVGDVARGSILAAEAPHAVGKAYNLSGVGELTQRQLLDTITDALGWPRVTRTVGFRKAYLLGLLSEVIGVLIFLKRAPYITRYVVRLVGRPAMFSTAKAREELGWQPEVTAAEGVRQSLEWFRTQPGNAELLEMPK